MARRKPRIPKTEPGHPEAGLQFGSLGVPDVEYIPKGKGEAVQISMDDAVKLAEAMKGEEQ